MSIFVLGCWDRANKHAQTHIHAHTHTQITSLGMSGWLAVSLCQAFVPSTSKNTLLATISCTALTATSELQPGNLARIQASVVPAQSPPSLVLEGQRRYIAFPIADTTAKWGSKHGVRGRKRGKRERKSLFCIHANTHKQTLTHVSLHNSLIH